MKTELRLRPHILLPDHLVIELWWDDQFIGEVTGADGPGVRVLSKFAMQVDEPNRMVTEVRIDPAGEST